MSPASTLQDSVRLARNGGRWTAANPAFVAGSRAVRGSCARPLLQELP
jgi:hypothetical protein